MSTAEAARKAGMSEHEITDMEAREAAARMTDEGEAKAKADADAAALAAVVNEGGEAAAEVDAAAAGAAATEETPGAAVDEPAEARATPFVPTYNVATPEGMAERLIAIKTELRDLKKKGINAEITADEWVDAEERLLEERETLTRTQAKAEYAREHSAQTTAQAIEHERKAFMRDAKKEGIDYADPKMRQRLDIAFSVIATHPDNANRTVTDAYDTFQEAHEIVKAQIKWKPAAPTVVKTTPTAAAPRDVPRTLATMPAAAPAALEDDVVSKLSTLVGEDREKYMASLPKKEVERLMKMS